MNTSERKIPVEVYDRTVGYFSSTMMMNKGKKEEQKNRKRFDANKYCQENFKNVVH